jgi:diguanylate cyclase (GGDEF)-like protein
MQRQISLDWAPVNDEHGHAARDEALRYLVAVMRPILRSSDNLYRRGGDEFLLLCPGADTREVARRIRRLLDDAPPLKLSDGGEVTLEVGVGSAHFLSGDDLSAQSTRLTARCTPAKRSQEVGS